MAADFKLIYWWLTKSFNLYNKLYIYSVWDQSTL